MNGQWFQVIWPITLTLLLASVPVAQSGKVLVFPVDGSHWVNMNILVEALSAKGHDVTVMRTASSCYIKEFSPQYTSINLKSKGGYNKEVLEQFASRLMHILRDGSTWGHLKLQAELWESSLKILEAESEMIVNMIGDQQLMQSLKDAKYNMILTDPNMFGGVILGHYLKLPMFYNVRWAVYSEAYFAIAPSPLSYVPFPFHLFLFCCRICMRTTKVKLQ